MTFVWMMLGALALDAAFGWPAWLYARVGHPVTWIGAVIARLERSHNRGGRQHRLAAGGLVTALVVATAAAVAWLVQSALPSGWPGILVGSLLAWPLIAARSLEEHVRAVADPLIAGNLPEARHAVSMIVGRNPDRLDPPGVARAAIESLAENASDGVTAPLFWGAVAGLPGIAAYKAINTLDSMIGHRNDRYEAFGKAAARLDDAANWVPARLTGLLFAVASGSAFGKAIRVQWRDAAKHRSPNAGWPESAMAAALDVRLSGPRVYDDCIADEPWLNGDGPDPKAEDIPRGIAVFRTSVLIAALALFGLGLL